MSFDPERLSTLNTNRFTVEDAAYAMKMWKWTTRLCLNTGVRRGAFTFDGKYYALIKSKAEE